MSFVYAIAFIRKKFVMVRHFRRRSWEMPGGEVNEGETPEEAIEREFREETGMEFEPISTRPIDGGTLPCWRRLSYKARSKEKGRS